jgi:DNA-binding beta-propeller fold protein YncE
MNRYGSTVSCSRALLIACVGLLPLAPALSSGQTVAAANCHLSFSSPLFIPISGTLQELIVDPQCQHVFVTNATTNRVEVISLVTGHLGAPIDVGSNPTGIDVSSDGSTLYVATTGANAVSVVNVAQNVQSGTIPVAPQKFTDDTPFSIAVANNGLAFLSTTFAGSGFGGRLLQLNLATGAVTQRTDFYIGGTTTEATVLRASSDKTAIGIVAGDISSGPVFAYTIATNKFTPEKDTDEFISRVATNGGVILANGFELGLGATLQQIGVFPSVGAEQLFDVAVDPSGKVGYRTDAAIGSGGANSVDVLDLQHVLVTGSLPLGDTVGSTFPTVSGTGHMAISGDGSLVAVITDHGVSLVQPNPVSFVQFTKFDSSVLLDTDRLAGSGMLRVQGYFVPAASSSIDLANQGFTLNVGAYSITIPAGSFSRDNGRFVFHTNMLSVTVLPGYGGSYEFEVAANGVTLNGSALPILVTLAIGTNEGSVTLSKTQAHFAPAGADQ